MTLLELWMIVKRRWKLVVALPVACLAVCAAYLFVTSGDEVESYEVTARVVANSQVAGVNGAATSEARIVQERLKEQYGEEDEAPKITVKSDGGTMTVSITVVGPDLDECVEIANSIAEKANDVATEAYAKYENPYTGQVEQAIELDADEESFLKANLKYLVVALLAGLFIAVCVIVVIDMVKRPVKTPEGVQDAVELPVLEILPAGSGERLLANVRFATGRDDLESVLVIPAGDVQAARAACDVLSGAVAAEGAQGVSVECGTPLSESMGSAYDSRDKGAVVVAVRQWADSVLQLESTVAELRLAKSNLVGIVFAKDKLA